MVPRCRACCPSFFFQAEDGIRGVAVTGVQTCALPISYVWKTGGRRPTTLRPGCGRTMVDSLRTGGGSVVFSLLEFRRKTRSQGWLRVGLTSLVIHTTMIGGVVYEIGRASCRERV